MTTATEPDELRRHLADQLADAGAIESTQWLEAFATVPREAFVPAFTVRTPEGSRKHRHGDPDWLPTVYSDASLLTQFDTHGTATSSSSQPSVMAHMLEALDAAEGHRVLEIGTGTGYNAALLAHRLGSEHVYSLDVDPALVTAARAALRKAGYTPTLTVGDGTRGWPERAPYDRLIATCGVPRIPSSWCKQVAPGGIIVANIGLGIVRLTLGDDRSASGRFLSTPAAFMTARPSGSACPVPAAHRTVDLAHATGHTQQITLPADLADQVPQFLGALAQPNVDQLLLGDDRYLLDQPTGSWARITPGPDDTARLEHDGPRDLWSELEPLLVGWADAGQPPIDAYELHVALDGDHRLILDTAEWPLTAV